MKITLEVTDITVLTKKDAPDHIILHTTLPTSFPAFDKGNACFDLQVYHGGGAQYVRDNFGINPTVISV